MKIEIEKKFHLINQDPHVQPDVRPKPHHVPRANGGRARRSGPRSGSFRSLFQFSQVEDVVSLLRASVEYDSHNFSDEVSINVCEKWKSQVCLGPILESAQKSFGTKKSRVSSAHEKRIDENMTFPGHRGSADGASSVLRAQCLRQDRRGLLVEQDGFREDCCECFSSSEAFE